MNPTRYESVAFLSFSGRAVVTMSTYETLSLMIGFGVLVATIIMAAKK
ncbi:putative holin-like toxin [Veillonella magna]